MCPQCGTEPMTVCVNWLVTAWQERAESPGHACPCGDRHPRSCPLGIPLGWPPNAWLGHMACSALRARQPTASALANGYIVYARCEVV